MNYYSYFFTRQDISPEQQIVQTAHAALKLGVNSQRGPGDASKMATTPKVPHLIDENVNPDETYFTLIGVRNKDALEACMSILDKFGYRYEVFYEPDIGDEPTSIAVYPIAATDRGPLQAFNLLKIGKV